MNNQNLFNLVFLCLFTICALSLKSQDVIIKKDGTEIQAKVLELTTNTIKYKEYDFQEGPTRNIPMKEVFMIIYSNGKREVISSLDDANQQEPNYYDPGTGSGQSDARSVNKKTSNDRRYGGYSSLAVGYGTSYGGTGLRFQYVTQGGQDDFRLGIHGGVGYLIGNPSGVLYSAGVNFFLYDYLFLNLQFGAFGKWEYSFFNGFSGFYDSGTIFGPSFQLGYDIYFTDNFGLNIASGISIGIDDYSQGEFFRSSPIYWSLDAGWVFKF